jgi:beta-mannanase
MTIASADGRRVLVTWEPWSVSGGVDQSAYRLKDIAAGKYDDYIQSWAYGLRDYPGPVFLRFAHEMNGNWYPWAGGQNGNTPADYIAAWRHVHDVFDRTGATNVRWVWCPYAQDFPAANSLESFYPGRRYVDVIALDAYNWGTGASQPGGLPLSRGAGIWQTVDQLLDKPYQRLLKLGPQPVWLAEIGSAEQGGDKAAWLHSLLFTRLYARVTAVVWFNDDKERNWRLDSSPTAIAAVHSAMAGTKPAANYAVRLHLGLGAGASCPRYAAAVRSTVCSLTGSQR